MTASVSTFALALMLVAVPCAAEEKPALDRYGDPLPPGAIARLGTIRWRTSSIDSIHYMPDGRIVSISNFEVRLWDPSTGHSKRLARRNEGGIRGNRIAFSPDRSTMAITDFDSVSFWNTATDKQESQFEFGLPETSDVVFAL